MAGKPSAVDYFVILNWRIDCGKYFNFFVKNKTKLLWHFFFLSQNSVIEVK